jgi:hypothetical protein
MEGGRGDVEVEVEVGRNRYLAIAHGADTIPMVAGRDLTGSSTGQLIQPHRYLLQLEAENRRRRARRRAKASEPSVCA